MFWLYVEFIRRMNTKYVLRNRAIWFMELGAGNAAGRHHGYFLSARGTVRCNPRFPVLFPSPGIAFNFDGSAPAPVFDCAILNAHGRRGKELEQEQEERAGVRTPVRRGFVQNRHLSRTIFATGQSSSLH